MSVKEGLVISSQGSDYVGYMGPCHPWERISTTFATSISRTDDLFLPNNITYKELNKVHFISCMHISWLDPISSQPSIYTTKSIHGWHSVPATHTVLPYCYKDPHWISVYPYSIVMAKQWNHLVLRLLFLSMTLLRLMHRQCMSAIHGFVNIVLYNSEISMMVADALGAESI